MPESTIQNWLRTERLPADLYQLLGRPRFDPDRERLLAAVRRAYGELLPYQNHQDPKVARRAMKLQMELGRAENVLSDPKKLRSLYDDILDRLRREYYQANRGPRAAEREQVQQWLKQQSIHPERIRTVAGLLASPTGETPDSETIEIGFPETVAVEPVKEEPKPEPSRAKQKKSQPPPGTTGRVFRTEPIAPTAKRQSPPVLNKAPPLPTTAKPKPRAEPSGPTPLPREPQQQPSSVRGLATMRVPPVVAVSVIGGAVVVALLLVFVFGLRDNKRVATEPPAGVGAGKGASLPKPPGIRRGPTSGRPGRPPGSPPIGAPGKYSRASRRRVRTPAPPVPNLGKEFTHEGRLVNVCQHKGEIHFFVEIESAAPVGHPHVEAFTRDEAFADEISDYRSDRESGRQSGDRVRLTGILRARDTTQFRQHHGAPLLELTAIERSGEPGSRAVVGRRRDRDSFSPEKQLTEIQRYFRHPPPVGTEIKLTAVYYQYTYRGVEVRSAVDSSQGVRVGFSAIPEKLFSDYMRGDPVVVEGAVDKETNERQLVLDGRSICRVHDAKSRITRQGRQTPPRDFEADQRKWESLRSNFSRHAGEKLEIIGKFDGAVTVGSCTAISIEDIFFGYNDTKAWCEVPPATRDFLAGLSKNEIVSLEILVLGGESYKPDLLALSIATRNDPKNRVGLHSQPITLVETPKAPIVKFNINSRSSHSPFAWSRDGEHLVFLDSNRAVTLANAKTGQVIGIFGSPDTDPVNDVSLSPNGELLATAGYNGVLQLWQTGTRRKSRVLIAPPDSSSGSSSTGSTRSRTTRRPPSSRSRRSTTRKSSAESDSEIPKRPTGPLNKVAWDSKGKYVAAVAGDKRLYICDSKRIFRRSTVVWPSVPDGGRGFAWHPKEPRLAVVQEDSVVVWDVSVPMKPKAVQVLIASDPSSAFKDYADKVLDLSPDSKSKDRPGGDCYGVAWSPDGTYLAIASNGVEIWHCSRPNEALLRYRLNLSENRAERITGSSSSGTRFHDFRSVIWSGDGKWLAATGGSKIGFWDPTTGQQIGIWPNNQSGPLACSGDGSRLATLPSYGGEMSIWKVSIGRFSPED